MIYGYDTILVMGSYIFCIIYQIMTSVRFLVFVLKVVFAME